MSALTYEECMELYDSFMETAREAEEKAIEEEGKGNYHIAMTYRNLARSARSIAHKQRIMCLVIWANESHRETIESFGEDLNRMLTNMEEISEEVNQLKEHSNQS